MTHRKRTGTQSAIGHGSTAATTNRNSAYEFSTELGANTPAAARAGGSQAQRVGATNQRTTVNVCGKYSK